MRPVDFTPDQIIEAGLELQSAGRSITGFALRKTVGGGQSNTAKTGLGGIPFQPIRRGVRAGGRTSR